MVKVDWVNDLDWVELMKDACELPEHHVTIARVANHQVMAGSNKKTSTRMAACKPQFSRLFERLVSEIRVRQYSIRAEQAYSDWVLRFLLFTSVKTENELFIDKISAFIEYLVVKRNVSASTQGQALNALVFFFRHILKIPLEESIDFQRAKMPRRLPVVLSRDETSTGIQHDLHRLMAEFDTRWRVKLDGMCWFTRERYRF